MRKVMVCKWVYEGRGTAGKVVERGEAVFHAISTDYEEISECGVGLYPCAVVEWPSGELESFPLHLVRFIENH
ncbi:MAG: hypothetical protein ACRCTL_10985 [Pseudomonas sp.]